MSPPIDKYETSRTVILDDVQTEWLAVKAKETNVSMSDIIREGVTRAMSANPYSLVDFELNSRVADYLKGH